jgi:hypothetical protein
MMQLLLVLSIVVAGMALLCVLGFAVEAAGYGWILRYRLWRARRRVEEVERQMVEAFRDRRGIGNEQSTANP